MPHKNEHQTAFNIFQLSEKERKGTGHPTSSCHDLKYVKISHPNGSICYGILILTDTAQLAKEQIVEYFSET